MILYWQILRCSSIGHYTEHNLIIFFKWHLKFCTCLNSLKIKPIYFLMQITFYIVLTGPTHILAHLSCCLKVLTNLFLLHCPMDNVFFYYTQAYITIFFPWTDFIFILISYTWKPELPFVCQTSTTKGLLLHALDRFITTQI